MDLDLASIPEDKLLDLRICDLPLRIEDTWLEQCIALLHQELKDRGIRFAPRCYLADEWLTPEGEPEIGIPFYLAHPRLVALEKKMMLEAEGETPEWCMKLLRHECGHALSYAFDLNKKKSWQAVFGSSSEPYEDTYRYRPYSKSFVRHLDYHYAQYHPDEDFCETFAVWLTPGLDWRAQYAGWKALAKLEFVDKLMRSIAGKYPRKGGGRQYWRASQIRRTLRRYYEQRRRADESQPAFHDANLERMFAHGQARNDPRPTVARLLEKYRKPMIDAVADWTGERKYMVAEVFKKVYQRSKALRLVTEEAESMAVLKLSTYLTTLLMNYRHTNRLRGHL
jgi:hypothetical protein